MTFLEIVISILIITFTLTSTILSFSNLLNLDISYEYIQTAVYSGLWKSSVIKEYNSNSCRISRKDNKVEFYRVSEEPLNGLFVIPFSWTKSGTFFKGITIEPIMFEVSNRKDAVN
ncbi:hypothetical protein [Fervidobacterium sp. 2310opik-2]|uniref:hypothetical protein n=1 Tax=Fervidobacterium sp. 2310opik-2 TaxID=1755815 RepID=UPI0013DED92E|nr:hypothetical protein [Fervidobacterium sp. 2310opik-2]KAF2961362.1 hypothetical protein AS161_08915 [Fervidobacterium sp. 2310opik-2]